MEANIMDNMEHFQTPKSETPLQKIHVLDNHLKQKMLQFPPLLLFWWLGIEFAAYEVIYLANSFF